MSRRSLFTTGMSITLLASTVLLVGAGISSKTQAQTANSCQPYTCPSGYQFAKCDSNGNVINYNYNPCYASSQSSSSSSRLSSSSSSSRSSMPNQCQPYTCPSGYQFARCDSNGNTINYNYNPCYASSQSSFSSSMSSSSSSQNQCQVITCQSGRQFYTCDENFNRINYSVYPCRTLEG